jgi:hypothetical protein
LWNDQILCQKKYCGQIKSFTDAICSAFDLPDSGRRDDANAVAGQAMKNTDCIKITSFIFLNWN